MNVALDHLFDAVDATWPAARTERVGPWLVGHGQGGGKRVSATTLDGTFVDADIGQAVKAMQDIGQAPLFMVRNGETALDFALESAGYEIVDPVVIYACPVAKLTDLPIPRVTVFAIWEPLAIIKEIWSQGGIGPARVAVMLRAKGAKTALLARWNEQPAGRGTTVRRR